MLGTSLTMEDKVDMLNTLLPDSTAPSGLWCVYTHAGPAPGT